MNCQDITHLLDDGDIGRLTDAMRGEVETHLRGCPACAAEWRVHRKLSAGFAPPMPAGLMERARALVVAEANAGSRRTPRRAILFGTLLAVAATAALLGAWLREPAHVEAAAVVSMPMPSPANVADDLHPAVQPTTAEPQPAAALPGTYTVRVAPVKIEGNDVTGNALALRFRELFIAKLRAVPGLVVVDPEAGDAGHAVYEIRMTYPGFNMVVRSRMLQVDPARTEFFAAADAVIAAEAKMDYAEQQRSQQARQREETRRLAAATRRNLDHWSLLGPGFPRSMVLEGPDFVPQEQVEFSSTQLVRDLRVRFFPLDPALEAELLAAVGDSRPGLDYSQNQYLRKSALGDLLSMADRRGGLHTAQDAVVRAGAELALIYREKTGRKAIWNALAATRNPVLIPYLIRGLDTTTQAETRLQLAGILTDFSDDPRARAALQAASRPDVQQLVRMAALRKSGEESKWLEYVVATLKDASLPGLLRLQPIAEIAPPPSVLAPTRTATLKVQLDDQTIRELGELIIKASLDTSDDDASRNAARKAVLVLGAVPGAAARDALFGILTAPDNLRPGLREESVDTVKSLALVLIASSFYSDPQARAAAGALAESPAGGLQAQQLLQLMDMKANTERLMEQQESRLPQ